jgi:hypothetical protein
MPVRSDATVVRMSCYTGDYSGTLCAPQEPPRPSAATPSERDRLTILVSADQPHDGHIDVHIGGYLCQVGLHLFTEREDAAWRGILY